MMNIHRYFDRANLRERTPSADVVDRIGQHQQDGIAGRDSGLRKTSGYSAGADVDVAVAERTVVRYDPRPYREIAPRASTAHSPNLARPSSPTTRPLTSSRFSIRSVQQQLILVAANAPRGLAVLGVCFGTSSLSRSRPSRLRYICASAGRVHSRDPFPKIPVDTHIAPAHRGR